MTRIFYAAFDLFPSPKGAATHMGHNLLAARDLFDSSTLFCLGAPDMPSYQEEGSITIHRCLLNHPNFLRRVDLYQAFLDEILDDLEPPDIVHFRDIWSGLPLLRHPKTRQAKRVFEVNGLPSIELPYHYPLLYHRPAFRQQLAAVEKQCLQQADCLVTVSKVNARCLEHRGAAAEKIRVISNCVQSNGWRQARSGAFESHDRTILYSGTLSPWQGVETLLRAFALLSGYEEVRLVLACSTVKHYRPIRKHIQKLGLSGRVQCHFGLPREELRGLYRRAYVSVAPLTRCDRNELQGCCPLKILESMAVGTPVIASSLAVCRELIDPGKEGLLVTPDAPRALAHALVQCLENSDQVVQMGDNARKKVALKYDFDIFAGALRDLYAI
jgi:glycosyltransferase involved in cell wall biosynthesis